MSGTSLKQRTLLKPASATGVGLHSGAPVTLRLLPAPVDHGLVFVRSDLPGLPSVPARADFIVDTTLATTLGRGDARVGTVEHLLAALAGLGVDNARLEVDGPEVPILDGSAGPFVDLLLEAGLREQAAPRNFLVVRKEVSVATGNKSATLSPSRRFKIECTVDFRHPLIADQTRTVEFTEATFVTELSRARTFGFLRDVQALQSRGLALGGSLANAIVVDEFSILNPEGLRFPDEFVRHKMLDALGDLSLLGMPVIGALTVNRSGHALNHQLVAKLLSDPANYAVLRAAPREELEAEESFELSSLFAPSAA